MAKKYSILYYCFNDIVDIVSNSSSS